MEKFLFVVSLTGPGPIKLTVADILSSLKSELSCPFIVNCVAIETIEIIEIDLNTVSEKSHTIYGWEDVTP